MPHFFFHLRHGPHRVKDEQGQDFDNAAAAVRHADIVARELVRNVNPEHALRSLVVVDDQGTDVAEISLYEISQAILSPPKKRRPLH